MPVDGFVFRPATVADSGAMGRVFEAAFDEPYGAAAVDDFLKPPAAFAVIAEDGLEGFRIAVGFVIAAIAADEGEVYSIGVDPAYRRKGIANALINYLLQSMRDKGAKKIFLEVAADNAGAIALYAKAGFKRVGLRRNYYRRRGGETVDALILQCDLA